MSRSFIHSSVFKINQAVFQKRIIKPKDLTKLNNLQRCGLLSAHSDESNVIIL